jgi:hypothetical protein
MLNLIEKYEIILLDPSDEIKRLANLYIINGIIPIKNTFDALHIACTTVYDLNILLSFNYRHINKIKTKKMTDNINILEGYNSILISTPMELLDNV